MSTDGEQTMRTTRWLDGLCSEEQTQSVVDETEQRYPGSFSSVGVGGSYLLWWLFKSIALCCWRAGNEFETMRSRYTYIHNRINNRMGLPLVSFVLWPLIMNIAFIITSFHYLV